MKLTFQARLAWSYTLVLLAAGAGLIAIIVLALQSVPDYNFAETVTVSPGTQTGSAAGTGVPPEPSPFSITSKADLLRLVLWVSAAALALMAVASLLLGKVLAKRLLRPVGHLSTAFKQASTGNLRHRINATGPADELKALSDTFDAMLGRLQTSFEAHQRFAASASHELLTPLAMNRTALQLIKDGPGEAELAELHGVLNESNERSIAVTQSLLRLAQSGVPPVSEPVDLAAVTAQVIAAQRVTLASCDLPALPTQGDPVLLRQLITNLVTNAVQHNHPGGTIAIRGKSNQDSLVHWSITNTGDHVDPAHLFEPFHRGNLRTNSTSSGHGLGLTIAAAIVHAHLGTIDAVSNPGGGLTVQLTLPRPAA